MLDSVVLDTWGYWLIAEVNANRIEKKLEALFCLFRLKSILEVLRHILQLVGYEDTNLMIINSIVWLTSVLIHTISKSWVCIVMTIHM